MAVGIKTGITSSAVNTASYILTTAVATPAFSVAAGTYSSTQTVSISDATTGAVIYYTIDGSVPTTSSAVYTGPISVSASETISAMGAASKYSNSGVAVAAYTIKSAAATPIWSLASGTYTTAQTVSIADSTVGATIYYTTNGSVPTTASTVYAGPITVSTSQTVQAIAVATNYSSSAVAAATYTITAPSATAPVFSVLPGSYQAAQRVMMATVTPNATIHYTTDGTTPTSSSQAFTTAVMVTQSCTVKAISVATDYTPSPVTVAAYTITASKVAPAPVFSMPSAIYATAQTITLSDAVSGATIYYTTDGSTPTTASKLYSAPIQVSATERINAIAVLTNYSQSTVASALYRIMIAVPTPTFSVPAASYSSTPTVALADTLRGAVIYYSTDGSTPTNTSKVYSAPFVVSATETVKAVAYATNYNPSAVASALYQITSAVPAPTFSLPAAIYSTAPTISLSDSLSGAVIHYTTDGSVPTGTSKVYTAPFVVSATATVNAVAYATTSSSASPVASALYRIMIPVPTPEFTVTAGTYGATQSVELTDTLRGAVIYYTTDGTVPTSSSTKYTGAIVVNASQTINATAYATNYNPSKVATASYVISVASAQ
jgi:hypothetical protein